MIWKLELLAFFLYFFTPTNADLACPPGFKLLNNNKCLKLFTTPQKHLEAESTCTQYGGTLAKVKNAIDNRAIVSMAASAQLTSIWIGMFCFGVDFLDCYFDDGYQNPNYSNFQSGFPKVDAPFGGCVYMATTGNSAGQWISGECEVTALGFVCEVPVTIADPTCIHNYHGNCYLPSQEIPGSSPSASFATAQQTCHQNSAELASIHSQQEVNYIRGLYKGVDFNSVLLGAIGSNWVDGSKYDFDYSDPLDNSTDSCLQMDTSARVNNGMWSKVDCGMEKQFLCKRRIVEACAHKFNGFCYIPSHEISGFAPLESFTDIEQTCSNISFNVVSVHSQQEQDYIISLFNGLNTNSIYLGAIYKWRWGYFQWLDYTPFDFGNFGNQNFTNLECLLVNTTTGLWYETDCYEQRYFVCKKPLNYIPFEPKEPLNLDLDPSQCNSTLYLAPGTVTSLGWPGKPTPSYCHWKLAALGPYRLGLYFTDLSIANELDVFDEYGNLLGKPSGNMDPFEILAPTNIVTMTHDGSGDTNGGHKGFRVVILPF